MNDNRFTPEELEIIKRHWQGEPPDQCIGKCNIKESHMIAGCTGCPWDDAGFSLTD